MAKIFISHSSNDKVLAKRLHEDLRRLGHEPWLDEWEIQVGDSISQTIEDGIAEARYVALILSPDAVASNWVDKEWRAKYWEEVQSGTVCVLPILAKNCKIPALIHDKKYADFRESYAVGLVELTSAIMPAMSEEVEEFIAEHAAPTAVVALLVKAQNPDVPLSLTLAEALEVTSEHGFEELALFCAKELAGWESSAWLGEENVPLYRLVQGYMSPQKLNLSYIGWGGDIGNVWKYVSENGDIFVSRKIFVNFPVSVLEAKLPKAVPEALLTTSHKAKDLWPDRYDSDLDVYVYTRGDAYKEVYSRIRVELTRRLLQLLPPINGDS